MKNSMIKFLLALVLLTTYMYAGGDIAPAPEPVAEPESDSGSALGIMSMFLFTFLTATVGSFFIKKEQ